MYIGIHPDLHPGKDINFQVTNIPIMLLNQGKYGVPQIPMKIFPWRYAHNSLSKQGHQQHPSEEFEESLGEPFPLNFS